MRARADKEIEQARVDKKRLVRGPDRFEDRLEFNAFVQQKSDIPVHSRESVQREVFKWMADVARIESQFGDENGGTRTDFPSQGRPQLPNPPHPLTSGINDSTNERCETCRFFSNETDLSREDDR